MDSKDSGHSVATLPEYVTVNNHKLTKTLKLAQTQLHDLQRINERISKERQRYFSVVEETRKSNDNLKMEVNHNLTSSVGLLRQSV